MEFVSPPAPPLFNPELARTAKRHYRPQYWFRPRDAAPTFPPPPAPPPAHTPRIIRPDSFRLTDGTRHANPSRPLPVRETPPPSDCFITIAVIVPGWYLGWHSFQGRCERRGAVIYGFNRSGNFDRSVFTRYAASGSPPESNKSLRNLLLGFAGNNSSVCVFQVPRGLF